jgi:hypothetical protein
MILKGLYLAIMDRIQDQCPEVRHIDLFNDQFNNEDQEDAFNTPAVLVEFAPFETRSLSEGRQDMEVPFILHIGTEQYEEASSREELQHRTRALEHLNTIDSVSKALHRYGRAIGGDIVRTGVETDINHYNMYVHKISFLVRVVDDIALAKYIPLGTGHPGMQLDNKFKP